MSNEKQRSPQGKRLKLLTILYHASAWALLRLTWVFWVRKRKIIHKRRCLKMVWWYPYLRDKRSSENWFSDDLKSLKMYSNLITSQYIFLYLYIVLACRKLKKALFHLWYFVQKRCSFRNEILFYPMESAPFHFLFRKAVYIADWFCLYRYFRTLL